nr:hypothetical protein [Tanacetum cinerariifolium]
MTHYSLWEVILNGDSPAPTRVVDGVLQPVAPTTAEQRLAKKNESKAHGTLLMALPDKHQLKFNSHMDAKKLMEAIEKRFGWNTETKKRNKNDLEEQSPDDFFNSLTIYEAEVKSSSSASTSTQNIAFVSSSNTDSIAEPVSAIASVAVCAKLPVSSFLNVDSLSNVVIYSFFASQSSSQQLDNDDLKQIDDDDLEEMDLKWQMAMECRSLKDTRRNGVAETHRRNVLVETTTSNALVSQCDGMGSYDWIFQAEEEPTNYALMPFSSSSSSSDNELRDNALVSLRQNLEKAEQEMDDLQLKIEKFQTSSKNLTELLASLGYNYQVFTHAMFDCNGYHVVPPPYTGTFMPPKPDLVFNNTLNDVKTDHHAFTVNLSPTKPDQVLSLTTRPSAPIIEDWVSDSEDESETKTPHHTVIPKPTSNEKCRNRKACFVCKSLNHFIKDCNYHEKKMAQPTVRNHAHKRNYKQAAPMTHQNTAKHMVPAAVLTQSKPVPITAVRPVSIVIPKISVAKPRHAKPVVTKPNSIPKRHINRSPSPRSSNSPPRVTVVKALVVNVAQG